MDELLRQAAEALDDGIDPFSTAWLREHEVSLDQAIQLSRNMAQGIRLMLDMRSKLRKQMERLVPGAGVLLD